MFRKLMDFYEFLLEHVSNTRSWQRRYKPIVWRCEVNTQHVCDAMQNFVERKDNVGLARSLASCTRRKHHLLEHHW
jgi:hypothetical protein